eukprot:Plantae.Rhodophyta-Rhodochaete_pulchella.ctg73342.p1 GENE.Plantae.Rhodophyta-Rhodochaete_pulchella.ctg73342~~Plantae.Rhodophyta-Rhodochaete_pulchella.ctg73342.p1  ORF type:complete len:174 (+),score=19.98 Plantae.Rhodophyta-Rhodochaete_pulchella.ctg73342:43-522(+)
MTRYVSRLPREAMRLMAGFAGSEHSYHVPRANVHVPATLRDAIFPGLQTQIVNSNDGGVDHASRKVVELLNILWDVFLQGAELLFDKYPMADPALPLFTSSEFLKSKSQVHATQDRESDIQNNRELELVALMLAEVIHENLSSIRATQDRFVVSRKLEI